MGRGDHKESYCTENQAAVRLFLEVLVVLQAGLRGIAAQLPEGRGFNLADTLAGKAKCLANLFKRVIPIRSDTVTETDNRSLAYREIIERANDFIAHRGLHITALRIRIILTADEIELRRIIVIADRRVDRFDTACLLYTSPSPRD